MGSWLPAWDQLPILFARGYGKPGADGCPWIRGTRTSSASLLRAGSVLMCNRSVRIEEVGL